jgi:cobalt/nickel transport system ATP-binding protein
LDKAIEIINLSYSYPDGHQALEDINIAVGPGETVALIGPNGAGKSTLLLHLNGIIRTDGAVRILGVTLDDKNLKCR